MLCKTRSSFLRTDSSGRVSERAEAMRRPKPLLFTEPRETQMGDANGAR